MSEKEVSEKDQPEVTEEPVAEETEDDSEAVEDGQEEVEIEAEESADVFKDRWVRLAAEFDNYKKRTLRERDALIRSANEGLIRDLLPIVDSADRATAHADGDSESEAFQTGVRMIMEELPKILGNRGFSEIESAGQQFDPNLHEALMQIASDHEAGSIVEVVERGYKLGENVLRHAKVVVSQGPATESEEKAE